MPATVTHLPTPTRPQDPATQAGLAELFQLALAVARLPARLATIEHAALDAIAEAATQSAPALAANASSLEDALRIGHAADALDAARDVIAARAASIVQSFERAARAVRRTAALQERLASGRPAPTPHPPSAHSRPTRPANDDADPPERADRYQEAPEDEDELGTMTGEEILHAIRRDLAHANSRLLERPATPLTPAPLTSATPRPTPTPHLHASPPAPAAPPPAPDT